MADDLVENTVKAPWKPQSVHQNLLVTSPENHHDDVPKVPTLLPIELIIIMPVICFYHI